MPITGMPGRPTTQGKNERSHQTLIKFLDANPPTNLEETRQRIRKFVEHYNHRRPHQALRDATPRSAWELLDHTPATEPIPLVVLEARAAEYLAKRRVRTRGAYRADLAVAKDGKIIHLGNEDESMVQGDQEAIVAITKDNHQVYFHGLCIKLPVSVGGREYFRTITDDEFILADPRSGEVMFSFPLPLTALGARGRYINSYEIQGVQLAHPNRHWTRKYEESQFRLNQRGDGAPEVFRLE